MSVSKHHRRTFFSNVRKVPSGSDPSYPGGGSLSRGPSLSLSPPDPRQPPPMRRLVSSSMAWSSFRLPPQKSAWSWIVAVAPLPLCVVTESHPQRSGSNLFSMAFMVDAFTRLGPLGLRRKRHGRLESTYTCIREKAFTDLNLRVVLGTRILHAAAVCSVRGSLFPLDCSMPIVQIASKTLHDANDALLGVHCITHPRFGALSPTKLRVHPLNVPLSTLPPHSLNSLRSL